MKLEIYKIEKQHKVEIIEIAKWFDSWYEWAKPKWSYKKILKRLEYFAKCKRIPSFFVAKYNGVIVGTIGICKYDDTKSYSGIFPFAKNLK